MNLEQKWQHLKNSNFNDGGMNTLRLSESCILELFVALDKDNCRYLILHLPENFKPNLDHLENENILLTYSSSQHLIAIKLLDIDFSDLFDDLINSMFASIKTEHLVEVASKKLVDNFIKWNQFFRKLENSSYGEESILGFWGELFTLYKLIKDKYDFTQINTNLEAWVGPLDSVHDFVFNDKNLEVKTKMNSRTSINFSSEFQLEVSSNHDLELLVVSVERVEDGFSIEDLYKKIKEHILDHHADLSILITRLHAFKLDESSLKKYNNYSFKPVKTDFYDCLQDEFPKLVSGALRDEIFAVKYKVDISNLDKFILRSEKY